MLPDAVVITITKATEQFLLVTVWIDNSGAMVEMVANCSPNRAKSRPPTPAVESEIVLLLRALTEYVEGALSVIDIVVLTATLIAACTVAPPGAFSYC